MATGFPVLSYQSPSRTLTNESTYSTETASKANGDDATDNESNLWMQQQKSHRLTQSHRKLVFTDPVAFRYLEEDESTIVIDRRRRLEGYELYVVEQWACSRIHPTFIICTFTGDNSSSILVNVLAIPTDPNAWSRRLKIYFEAVSQSYAREKETPLGSIMVTNLSGFPSSLSVVAVPDGDVRRHREDFIVNENLKRMGCSGRAAFSLTFPQASTINKFHHLYHTSERVPLYSSVMELVRFCQTALVLFGKLQPSYADGLLCDLTEKAVSNWWNDIGTDFHNVEPSDGILGPTTVSALIGLTIGAYNRLKEAGAPVGKDPMDLSSMKRAVGHFQKSVRMDKTRRLDRATLDRLHRATAKSAAEEGFGVTRAIKSTIGELGGKGGEMIARGLGGGREKASIAEVETLDIDRLSQLVSGPSMKWLWQGKEMKSASSALFGTATDELNGRVFSTDDQGNFIWTSQEPQAIPEEVPNRQTEGLEERRRTRDIMRSHAGRFGINPDEVSNDPNGAFLGVPGGGRTSFEQGRKRSSTQTSARQIPAYNLSLAENHERPDSERSSKHGSEEREIPTKTDIPNHREVLRGLDKPKRDSPTQEREQIELQNVRSKIGSTVYQNFSANLNLTPPNSKALQRSQSAIQLRGMSEIKQNRLARHLSFSIVAEPIYRRRFEEGHSSQSTHKTEDKPLVMKKIREYEIILAQKLTGNILQLERGLTPFVTSKVEIVERLSDEAQTRLNELNNQYYQNLEEYQTLQATSTDLVAREKGALTEGMRRIEMLGQKLDYELGELNARIQEVEEEVDNFERSVIDTEANVKALVEDDDRRPVPWFQRMLNLWGTPKSVASAAAAAGNKT